MFLEAATVPVPLVQTESEWEAAGLRALGAREFWYYRCPAYLQLRPLP